MDCTELDARIDHLEELADDVLSGEGSWGEFWSYVRNIRECFKDRELRYPSREERNRAWGRFQALVSDTKETQQERSGKLRNEVMSRLDSIQLPMGGIFGASADLLGGMFTAVAAPGFGRFESSEKSLLRMAAAELKEARTRYHEIKRLLTPEDNNAVWKRIQEVQAELQSSWEDRDNANRQARLSRLQDARAGKREYIERVENRQRKVAQNLASNEERLQSARGDDFRKTVEGWIAVDRERLEELDEEIEDARTSLREIEEKINGLE